MVNAPLTPGRLKVYTVVILFTSVHIDGCNEAAVDTFKDHLLVPAYFYRAVTALQECRWNWQAPKIGRVSVLLLSFGFKDNHSSFIGKQRFPSPFVLSFLSHNHLDATQNFAIAGGLLVSFDTFCSEVALVSKAFHRSVFLLRDCVAL